MKWVLKFLPLIPLLYFLAMIGIAPMMLPTSTGHCPEKPSFRHADAVVRYLMDSVAFSFVPERADLPVHGHLEISQCPWNPNTRLALVGIWTDPIVKTRRRPVHCTFLVDVSKSMDHPKRLDLFIDGFLSLVRQLRSDDTISICVYADSDGVVLPPTPGDRHWDIAASLSGLKLAQPRWEHLMGIRLAGHLATRERIKNGTNRLILVTDGDLGVRVSHFQELTRIVEALSHNGIDVGIFHMGPDNGTQPKLELLANKANGSYHQIMDFDDAQMALANVFQIPLPPVVENLETWVAFNSNFIQSYRLMNARSMAGWQTATTIARNYHKRLAAGQAFVSLYQLMPRDADASETSMPMVSDGCPYDLATDWISANARFQIPGQSGMKMWKQSVSDSHSGISTASKPFQLAAALAQFHWMKSSGKPLLQSMETILNLMKSNSDRGVDALHLDFVRFLEKKFLNAKQANPHDCPP